MTGNVADCHTAPIAAFALVRYGGCLDLPMLESLSPVERASLGDREAAQRAAAILAAKKAVRRLFPALDVRDIEVLRREHSAPLLRINGRPTELPLSLSHDGGLAVAGLIATPDWLEHNL